MSTTEVVDAGGDDLRLSGRHKNLHQRLGEDTYKKTDDETEEEGAQESALHSLPDPVFFFCAVILGDKGGKRVPKVLYRHVGEGVDLHRRREGRHDDRAEAVDKPLDHEDAKIHDRLLETGEKGKAGDFVEDFVVPFSVLLPGHHLREADPCVDGKTDAGHILGEDGGKGSPCHAPVKDNHKHQIKHNVHHRGHSQEDEGDSGVPDGPQQAGEIIVEKCPDNSCEYDKEIILHQSCDGAGDTQEPDDSPDAGKDRHVQHDCHRADKDKGLKDARLHPVKILLAVADGKGGAAAHTEPQDDRGKKGHQSVGTPHCRQGVRPEKAAHDDGVRDIVALLQEISRDHGQCEDEQALCDAACQKFAFLHKNFPPKCTIFYYREGNSVCQCRIAVDGMGKNRYDRRKLLAAWAALWRFLWVLIWM